MRRRACHQAREARRRHARARLRAIVAPEPGWRRFVIHYLGTAVGGYLLLMVVIIGYYFGISPVAGNFVQSAFSGCALLIGLATPVFIALSWLVERKGWRSRLPAPANRRSAGQARRDPLPDQDPQRFDAVAPGELLPCSRVRAL